MPKQKLQTETYVRVKCIRWSWLWGDKVSARFHGWKANKVNKCDLRLLNIYVVLLYLKNFNLFPGRQGPCFMAQLGHKRFPLNMWGPENIDNLRVSFIHQPKQRNWSLVSKITSSFMQTTSGYPLFQGRINTVDSDRVLKGPHSCLRALLSAACWTFHIWLWSFTEPLSSTKMMVVRVWIQTLIFRSIQVTLGVRQVQVQQSSSVNHLKYTGKPTATRTLWMSLYFCFYFFSYLIPSLFLDL